MFRKATTLFTIFLIGTFLLIGASIAMATSEGLIEEAMNTSFTELDFFLFKVLMNETISKRGDLKFTGLKFDYDEKKLYLDYEIKEDVQEKFKTATHPARQRMLQDNLDKLLMALAKSLRQGGIWAVKGSVGRQGFDREAFYQAMAERTIITVSAEVFGRKYELRRTPGGQSRFTTSEGPEDNISTE